MSTSSNDACRSWLYAPGDNPKLVERVFTIGADAVILDLEDSVRPENKGRARSLVAATLQTHSGWARINRPGTEDARRDLEAVASCAIGLRIPKVETAEEIDWVRLFCPDLPLIATIETALGVEAAAEIASHPAVVALALGAADLTLDLSLGGDDLELLYVRSQMVIVSRAAGIGPPIDSVYLDTGDLEGLSRASQRARRLGFFGKSAIHPRQVPVINEAFTPTADDVAAAQAIVDAFTASHGEPTTHAGLFIDAPVADRAHAIIRLARKTRDAYR